MFEAVDLDRDHYLKQLAVPKHSKSKKATTSQSVSLVSQQPSEAIMLVLEAGFRSRVMSWQSAFDLGARSGLSLDQLRERSEQCAQLIRAGLTYAVDESLFAALVFQYPQISKDISHIRRS